MSSVVNNRGTDRVGIEDVVGVTSRVSWSAVLAGSVVAVSVYMLLGMFFTGVGLSLNEAGVRGGTIAWVAVIAAVLSLLVAMFVGGGTTSMLTVGENRREAMVYGLLTWAVVTTIAITMVGMGIRGGYNAILGASVAAQRTDVNWEQVARDAGVSQQRIDAMKAQADPANVRATAQDPEVREDVREGAMTAAWVTFFGTLLSLGSAVAGSVSCAGPSFRLFPVASATVASEHRLVTP